MEGRHIPRHKPTHGWKDLNPADRDHVTLMESQTAGKRVLIVGDVHGCYDHVMALLRNIGALNRNETDVADDVIVIFVGDIINKGPKNLEVLRWVRKSTAYCITGNHEVNVLESGPNKYEWAKDCTKEDFEYMQRLPWTVEVKEHHLLVVHAGLIPNIPLQKQTEYTMVRMRNIWVRGDEMVPQDDKEYGKNWVKYWRGPWHVVYGHDASRGKDKRGRPRVQEHEMATGLDTRCVYGGVLTGLLVMPDGKRQFVQTVR